LQVNDGGGGLLPGLNTGLVVSVNVNEARIKADRTLKQSNQDPHGEWGDLFDGYSVDSLPFS